MRPNWHFRSKNDSKCMFWSNHQKISLRKVEKNINLICFYSKGGWLCTWMTNLCSKLVHSVLCIIADKSLNTSRKLSGNRHKLWYLWRLVWLHNVNIWSNLLLYWLGLGWNSFNLYILFNILLVVTWNRSASFTVLWKAKKSLFVCLTM